MCISVGKMVSGNLDPFMCKCWASALLSSWGFDQQRWVEVKGQGAGGSSGARSSGQGGTQAGSPVGPGPQPLPHGALPAGCVMRLPQAGLWPLSC